MNPPLPPIITQALAVLPLRDRLQMRVRARVCPFQRLLEALPSGGRLLEIGCGHGVFCLWAKFRHPGLEIVGADIDGRKVAAAKRVAARLDWRGLSFQTVDAPTALALAGAPYDAIAMIDVLLCIPESEWPALFGAVAHRLRAGGSLLLKALTGEPSWRRRLSEAQEVFASRVFRITAGRTTNRYLPDGEMIALLSDAGFRVELRDASRGHFYPHNLFVCTKA